MLHGLFQAGSCYNANGIDLSSISLALYSACEVGGDQVGGVQGTVGSGLGEGQAREPGKETSRMGVGDDRDHQELPVGGDFSWGPVQDTVEDETHRRGSAPRALWPEPPVAHRGCGHPTREQECGDSGRTRGDKGGRPGRGWGMPPGVRTVDRMEVGKQGKG